MLETVHHQGLRLALGAFRASPVASLYVEADETALSLHKEKISFQYAIRLAGYPSNPASEATFQPQFSEFYENKPNAVTTFGFRIAPLLEVSNINPRMIQKHFVTSIPSWCMKKPTVIFDLHNGIQSNSNPHILKAKFPELQSR